MAMGAVMVVVALAMLGELDIKFQNRIASDLPSFLVNPSKGLEDTAAAHDALVDIRGEEAHGIGGRAAAAEADGGDAASRPAQRGRQRPARCSAPAPEFVGTQQWFNTPGGRPLTLKGLRGRVVLIDFWTYSCINCLRTLPYLEAWDKRYRKDGLTIVGVHSPEFPFEKDAGNVADAIERNGIRYPVVQDNDLATWSAWGNQYWPAEYFVDAKGEVRYTHFGEGEYGEKEHVIRELLAEAGHRARRARSRAATGWRPRQGVTTPETYLGAARAERFTNPMLSPGTHDFGDPPRARAETNSPTAGAGGSRSTRRPRSPAPRWTSTSAPGASTSCSAPRTAAAGGCGSCSTAGRSPTASPGPTSTAARWRSPSTASTTSSTCPGSSSTSSPWCRNGASPATPSPSARRGSGH